MKKTLIVTHIRFWASDSGDAARLRAMVSYLSHYTDLTVVFGGALNDKDHDVLRTFRARFKIVILSGNSQAGEAEYLRLFGRYIESQVFDVCIVEHVYLSFVLPLIPAYVKVILDTHDIVSDRMKSFREMNLNTRLTEDIAEDEELAYFRRYDVVVVIQSRDYEKVSGVLGKDRTILVPHAVDFRHRKLREKAGIVGFVGSSYVANVDAIRWFVDTVWSRMDTGRLILNIYGNVSRGIEFGPSKSLFVKGFVPDLDSIYDEMDIVVSPVRCGAGLKIKNVEAMGYGLPLITTTHGAVGIEEGRNDCFLVANEPGEFCRCINQLADSYLFRERLGDNAYEFVRKRHSPEVCFERLLYEINSPKRC